MQISEVPMSAQFAGAAVPVEARSSAVSWKAVLAGTVVAVAITLVLLTLGSGLGASAVSPWSDVGIKASTAGALAATWIIVVQWLSAAAGGYVTGRLRTRWVNTHTHEVFFRDTAHGFITWATATLAVAVVLTSVALGTAGAGIRAAARVGSGAAQGAGNAMPSGSVTAYDTDTLFRSSQPGTSAPGTDRRAEVSHILAKGVAEGDVSPADRTYLASIVATSAGLTQEDAQKRVDDVIAQVKATEAKARQAADDARKAAARASILAALAMIIGAFVACIASALGGRERDLHP